MCFGICVGGSHAVHGAFEAAEGEDAVCAGDVAGYHFWLGGGGCVGDDDWFGVVVMVSEMPLAVSCGG